MSSQAQAIVTPTDPLPAVPGANDTAQEGGGHRKEVRRLETRLAAAEERAAKAEAAIEARNGRTAARIKQLLDERHELKEEAERLRASGKGTSPAAASAEYQRGRADVLREQAFVARLAAAQARFPDFKERLAAVRPLVPRAVAEEIADSDDAMIAGYLLANNAPLCEELSRLAPEAARERFKVFVRDVHFGINTGIKIGGRTA